MERPRRRRAVDPIGLEPMTRGLQSRRSTPELRALWLSTGHPRGQSRSTRPRVALLWNTGRAHHRPGENPWGIGPTARAEAPRTHSLPGPRPLYISVPGRRLPLVGPTQKTHLDQALRLV